MTLLFPHHDDGRGFARTAGLPTAGFFRRIGTAFRILHRSIVTAKLRRLQGEWLLRPDYSEIQAGEPDATKFPQRPLILGDKWDF